MNLKRLLILAALALAGCTGASADTVVPAGRLAVTVSISSATLADDCNPPAPSDKPSVVAPANRRPRDCRQTSVQLALASDAKVAPSTLTIEKAQLFDATSGALLQTMTTRNPQVWSAAGRYDPWNRVVKGDQKLQVSFDMNAPDWSKMGGSQLAAQGKTFRLELTVRVGGQITKVGSTVRSAEIIVEPPMPPT